VSAIQQAVLSSYAGGASVFSFSDVKLLLHMNGSNGGTTFTDSSLYARTVTPTSATTSTTQTKYGSAAAAFASGTAKLAIAHSADLVPAGDFTLEAWVWPSQTTSATDRMIVAKMSTTGHRSFSMEITTAGYVKATASNAAGSTVYVNIAASGANTIPAASWSHVAFQRAADVWTLFLNGTPVATTTVSGAAYSNASDSLWIGNTSNSGLPLFVTGTHYLDDLRLVKGYALYASGGFTPPPAELPDF
jgi:hypothetical protein